MIQKIAFSTNFSSVQILIMKRRALGFKANLNWIAHVDKLVPSFSAVQNMKRKIDIAKGQILLVVWNTLWQKRTSSSTTWRNVECLLNNNRITSQHNAFNNNMKQFLKLLENVVYKICCHQCTHLMSQLINSKATGIFNPHLILHFEYLLLRKTLLYKSVQHFGFKL